MSEDMYVLVHTAPSPCELPSLSEVGSQYLVFGKDCNQYAYGYNAGSSAKVELKKADGTVYGAYHYIDANNVTQKVNYTVNDVDGFMVDASNLPVPVKDATVEDSTGTEVPTTLPSVGPEEETTSFNLVRGSSAGSSKDHDRYKYTR
uniref:Cuticle protein n=1 Tax=Anopheles christyi TaxID=43041 RepID=A0A182K206_9DIPT